MYNNLQYSTQMSNIIQRELSIISLCSETHSNTTSYGRSPSGTKVVNNLLRNGNTIQPTKPIAESEDGICESEGRVPESQGRICESEGRVSDSDGEISESDIELCGQRAVLPLSSGLGPLPGRRKRAYENGVAPDGQGRPYSDSCVDAASYLGVFGALAGC